MSRSNPPKPSANPPQRHQLRIIGGQWRGRKLPVLNSEGLRPTSDRIRETLFNWLAVDVAGSRCLDLFAGSGALGFEALSRQASHCDFIDISAPVCTQLQHNIATLKANATAQQVAANDWLEQKPHAYDIIFLDPPFRQQLLQGCIDRIQRLQLINRGGWIYLETASDEPAVLTPADWQCHRSKTAGQVRYQLFSIHH